MGSQLSYLGPLETNLDAIALGATTSNPQYQNQYNFASVVTGNNANLAAYHSGEKSLHPDCSVYDSTGYHATGHQDNLEGIVGTWAAPGVQCEACHGPGSLHTGNPYGIRMPIDRDAQACGPCHSQAGRGSVRGRDSRAKSKRGIKRPPPKTGSGLFI